MYIPKSKIQPNLYTNGGEYLLEGIDYVGRYHLLYNGKAYTGIDQYDGTPQLLVKYTPSNAGSANGRINDQVAFPFERTNTAEEYSSISINVSSEVQAPLQYYPKPSSGEINTGEMTRYFLKRFNDQRFVEVNQETYESIKNQDKRFAWELWIAFEVPWLIKGSAEEVARINKQIVSYTEHKLQLRGLSRFLKNNYTEFRQQS